MTQATVHIQRFVGSGPTGTNIDGINTRANAADAHTTGDTASPIYITPATTTHSYAVWERLVITSNPDGHTINNLRWYTDGSNGFGTGVSMGAKTTNTYSQATGTTGSGNLVSGLTDAFTFTAGSPLAVSGSNNGTGAVGDWVVYQAHVDGDTVAPGVTPTESIFWRYDESP